MLSYFINREYLKYPLFPSNCRLPMLTALFFDFTWRTKIVGISLHIKSGFNVWRIPLAFQLVPAGLMAIGLLTVRESPRWLASKGRIDEALTNLAYLRKLPTDDERVRHEMAEIEAAINEEKEARVGLGLKEVFFGKGNSIRFVIAIVIFILQQWSGQNSVGYYAPQIFQSVSPFLPNTVPILTEKTRSDTQAPPSPSSPPESTASSK